MPWYKKFHRDIKKLWDKSFRPVLEPLLTALVLGKAKDKIDRS